MAWKARRKKRGGERGGGGAEDLGGGQSQERKGKRFKFVHTALSTRALCAPFYGYSQVPGLVNAAVPVKIFTKPEHLLSPVLH